MPESETRACGNNAGGMAVWRLFGGGFDDFPSARLVDGRCQELGDGCPAFVILVKDDYVGLWHGQLPARFETNLDGGICPLGFGHYRALHPLATCED